MVVVGMVGMDVIESAASRCAGVWEKHTGGTIIAHIHSSASYLCEIFGITHDYHRGGVWYSYSTYKCGAKEAQPVRNKRKRTLADKTFDRGRVNIFFGCFTIDY